MTHPEHSNQDFIRRLDRLAAAEAASGPSDLEERVFRHSLASLRPEQPARTTLVFRSARPRLTPMLAAACVALAAVGVSIVLARRESGVQAARSQDDGAIVLDALARSEDAIRSQLESISSELAALDALDETSWFADAASQEGES